VEKAGTLLLPFVARKDQGLAAAINGDLTAAKTALAAFGAQGSFPSYETVPQAARDDLGGRFSHLAVDLRKIAPTLGFQ
jgi:iron uptake system EfeUOB component EfeO/EfeM